MLNNTTAKLAQIQSVPLSALIEGESFSEESLSF